MSISILNRGASGGLTGIINVSGLSQTDTVSATHKIPTVVPNPDYVGLPEGYTQLEYIASTGTQYINTGFYAKNTTKIIVDCEITSGSSWSMAFGSYGESKDFSLWIDAYGELVAYYGTSYAVVPSASGRIKVIADKNNWSAGSSTTILTDSVFTATIPTYLFSVNGGGSYALATMKLYSCQIFDNESLVRDFVPAKRNSDSVVGLYDPINDVFYENAGTGVFTTGAETPQYTTEYVDGKTINGVWNLEENRFEIAKIKETGIWTVTATNGTNTSTQNVQMDVIGIYDITISLKLWLYNLGDECTDITGGWSQGAKNANTGSITKNADSITVYSSGTNSSRGITTDSLVDITGYSKAYMVVDISTSNEAGCFGHWGFAPVKSWSDSTPDGTFGSSEGLYGYNKPSGSVKQGQNILLEFSFDKSGSYYAYIVASAGAGANQTIVLKKMWLE